MWWPEPPQVGKVVGVTEDLHEQLVDSEVIRVLSLEVPHDEGSSPVLTDGGVVQSEDPD